MEPTRDELLIHRVVESMAQPSDWSELEMLARSDSAVWERLADAIRIEGALRSVLDDAVSVADDIELPSAGVTRVSARKSGLLSWSGWAAALVLAFLWLGTGTDPASDTGASSSIAHADSQEALEQYFELGREEGRVLYALPSTVMTTWPAVDGKSLEVLYVRRVLERTVVSEMYEVNQDETGQLTSVPAELADFVSTGPH